MMPDTGVLVVGVVALYYAAAAYVLGRYEWRRQPWLPRRVRIETATLAAVFWPVFVWMGLRDERGAWCVVESYEGIPGTLDAEERVLARFWTERGAYRFADTLTHGWLEVAAGVRVTRYDTLDR